MSIKSFEKGILFGNMASMGKEGTSYDDEDFEEQDKDECEGSEYRQLVLALENGSDYSNLSLHMRNAVNGVVCTSLSVDITRLGAM